MNLPRITTALAILAIAFAATPTALAHTHLHHTSIADKATLAHAPASFSMEFEGKTGLVNLTLTDAAGKTVPLTYTPPRDQAAAFTIPLPKLAAGAYTFTWRTLGPDGHAVPGAVHFTVTGG